jgi:hypothetical protein
MIVRQHLGCDVGNIGVLALQPSFSGAQEGAAEPASCPTRREIEGDLGAPVADVEAYDADGLATALGHEQRSARIGEEALEPRLVFS